MTNNECLTEQQITLFCTEDLPVDEMTTAAAHLSSCLECKRQQAAVQQTLASLPQQHLNLTEAEKLQFTARVIESKGRKNRIGNLQVWGAAATTITAGVLAFMIFSPANLQIENLKQQNLQYAELDLVENIEFLEEMEILELLELLELLDEKG